MDLTIWWEALSLTQKVYWIIAVPSTLIFLIQLVMLLIGGGADTPDFDADGDFPGDHGAGIDIFSVKSIITFLMFFGWTGLAAISKGFDAWWSIGLLSFVVGLVMMVLSAWLFWMLFKLQGSGNVELVDSIGKVAEVYITIPAKKKSSGKIQIALSGSIRTLDAVTEDLDDIKPGSFVEVLNVVNDILVVTRKR